MQMRFTLELNEIVAVAQGRRALTRRLDSREVDLGVLLQNVGH